MYSTPGILFLKLLGKTASVSGLGAVFLISIWHSCFDVVSEDFDLSLLFTCSVDRLRNNEILGKIDNL